MAGSPVLWGPNNIASNLESGIQFSGSAGPSIQTGTVNPSSTATAGVQGSLYLNSSTAVIYVKQDAGTTTNWTALNFNANDDVGTIVASGASTAPAGTLLANGTAVSRTTYAALFAKLGTTWGAGNGSTTFNLPNLQAAFLRGAGSQTVGGIAYSATLGAVTGDTMQGHFHSGTKVDAGNQANAGAGVFAGNTTSTVGAPSSDGTNGTPRTGFETAPVNAGVNYYVRYSPSTGVGTSGGSGITRSVNIISTATVAGSASTTDYVYFVSGTTTLTLPTAVGNTNRYTVKNTGSNTVTIATTSAQTIDGSSTASLPVANTSLDLISDGSNWQVV